MSVLRWLVALLVLVAAPCAWSSQPLKVLRIAFPASEDGFDPARIIDLYSHSVVIHICESLYAYDYLSRVAGSPRAAR